MLKKEELLKKLKELLDSYFVDHFPKDANRVTVGAPIYGAEETWAVLKCLLESKDTNILYEW